MKKEILLIIVISLSSCLSRNRPYYPIYESYQIVNTSSHDVVLHFYKENAPKTIYCEIKDQTGLWGVGKDSSSKDVSLLTKDSLLALSVGQTALLYSNEDLRNSQTILYSLYPCGTSDGTLSLFCTQKYFIGDSVTFSMKDEEERALPLFQHELWETWYDNMNSIYYHCWRIKDNIGQFIVQ